VLSLSDSTHLGLFVVGFGQEKGDAYGKKIGNLVHLQAITGAYLRHFVNFSMLLNHFSYRN